MLYLVATPIGNLGDFSYRAVTTLRAVDYILCEDTRHSLRLLQHYEIARPLNSFHKFNEAQRTEQVIKDLQSNKEIALLSDAGTPGIADPGQRLVQQCQEARLPMSVLPGPCAAIVGLTLSGFSNDRFQFVGFFPRKLGERKRLFLDVIGYPGVTVGYESPKRIADLLAVLAEVVPDIKVGIARELTKRFEECFSDRATALAKRLAEEEIKGEIVVLIEGDPKYTARWLKLSPEEHAARLEKEYGLRRLEAVRVAVKMRNAN